MTRQNRHRIDRGPVHGTCDQCFTTGPMQVFDSFLLTRRMGLLRARTDWHRSWVCPTCGYARRQVLPDQGS